MTGLRRDERGHRIAHWVEEQPEAHLPHGRLAGWIPAAASAYRSLASLQADNRRCRACAEAGFPLESRPVLEGHLGQRAFIYGQAPGIVEGAELRPWRGRAGQTLRRWLDLDEDEFYATFYCASVTRCYPGPVAVRLR